MDVILIACSKIIFVQCSVPNFQAVRSFAWAEKYFI